MSLLTSNSECCGVCEIDEKDFFFFFLFLVSNIEAVNLREKSRKQIC